MRTRSKVAGSNLQIVKLWETSDNVYRSRHRYDPRLNRWVLQSLPPTPYFSNEKYIIDVKRGKQFPLHANANETFQMRTLPFNVGKSRDPFGNSARLYARAYDKLIEEISGKKAVFIMSLAQIDKTFDMVAQTVNRLMYLSAKDKKKYLAQRRKMRKGLHPADRAADAKMVNESHDYWAKKPSQKVADGWLMNSYGVQPLVADLIALNDVIDRSYKSELHKLGRVKATASQPAGQDTKWDGERRGETRSTMVTTGRVSVNLSAEVEITSAYYALSESMGILNLGLAANDRIPFSFILNYWTNHEKYIASLSALAGLKLTNTYTTYYYVAVKDGYQREEPNYSAAFWRYENFKLFERYSERVVGKLALPSVTSRMVMKPTASWRRALNTIALARVLSPK